MIKIMLICCLILCSCASKLPLNDFEKRSLALQGVLQAGDYYTTKQALDRGAVEANPIYGKNPSDGKLIVGKVIGFFAVYGITKSLSTHKSRKHFLNIVNIVMGGIVIHNHQVSR